MANFKNQESIRLKELIQRGDYSPAPDQVAVAILRRPGMRLLLGAAPSLQAGRTPTA